MKDTKNIHAEAPLIAIVGQTASGKSTLALRLAEMFNGEIIAADSWTVRKGLDIGTAKPSMSERKSIKHHLLDIVEPCQDFTAAEFQKQATSAVKDIQTRNHVPILVGGTGLYVDSVLYDYSFSPPGSSVQRDAYSQLSIEELLKEAESKMLDTSSIDVRNKRRIIRLLETNGATPSRRPLRENTLVLGVRTEKDMLDDRINKRVELMLEQGLEGEVRSLAEEYGWDCEAMKGIGYVEWREYFEGSQTIEQTKARIVRSTKNLAKRQHTWFKRSSDIIWCSSTGQAEEKVSAFLKTS